ncbi:hypothetical protein DFH09DRAFT_1308251 [Mycena vulgaris]|nr:hypothetical protein DFH09DRAFT_1308251 [Mycena vulgaris]
MALKVSNVILEQTEKLAEAREAVRAHYFAPQTAQKRAASAAMGDAIEKRFSMAQVLLSRLANGEPVRTGAAEQFVRSMSPAKADDELLSYYRGSHRNLCESQYQLTMTQCNISAHYEFESVGANWPTQKRKDVVQEAIIRVFKTFLTFQTQRRECCEISIAFMKPKFPELLEHFVLEDMTQIPADPIMYPVRVWLSTMPF